MEQPDALSDPAVARVVRRVVAEVSPLRVVLFGSRATGHARPDSDVDLLVVVPDGTPRREVLDRLYRAHIATDVGVDFVAATPEVLARERDNPGLIYKEALRTGRDVYVAP